MRKPNGYGSVVKLSGKRRKPYAFRITDGWELNKKGIMSPKYKYLEYFETVREASEYQAAFNSGHTVKEHIAINKTTLSQNCTKYGQIKPMTNWAIVLYHHIKLHLKK